MTPDTGMDSANGDQNINTTLVVISVAAVIDKVYSMTGKNSILVTHSQGGLPWMGYCNIYFSYCCYCCY